ncbi:MAPEG family protein [Cyanobacteria bacterium FACHB-63]|nr:MAPEG family protein [Cyanobacteria bacterium FACHB-63]
MMSNPVPISTLFIGLNGLIAFVLSYIVVMERTSTRVWHGETRSEVSNQPNYLENPGKWAAFVETYTQKSVATKDKEDGLLQRKVRAHGNFVEYVPLALLLILTLELMNAYVGSLWLLGGSLTVGRIAHAWGLIKTYGPSPGRAIGFFLTWFTYLVGAGACIYYGTIGVLQ